VSHGGEGLDGPKTLTGTGAQLATDSPASFKFVPHLTSCIFPIEREPGAERLTSFKLPLEAALPGNVGCRREKVVELKFFEFKLVELK